MYDHRVHAGITDVQLSESMEYGSDGKPFVRLAMTYEVAVCSADETPPYGLEALAEARLAPSEVLDALGRAPEWAGSTEATVLAALLARQVFLEGDDTLAPALGAQFLGLGEDEQWREAVSTALLGEWTGSLIHNEGVSAPAAVHLLRSEARVVHSQLAPLWRRTHRGRRIALLETPVYEGATLRDLLADRTLPDDRVLDQIPGDRRLVGLLDRLAPTEQAVVLALGQPGVASWTEAAELTGSTHPDKDGEKVRRKVRRAVQELRRQDGQRADGPTGLWTPALNGAAQ
ncbi:hypothetical protein ACIG0C_30045 [Kitasatospora aureofaciens]|uniref:Uncharacterized protein n=1 Tax=Kitasatospora aureofaciens TaxID=1894 RepID=A0A1E7NEA2_KITAU|nr:hypothetical protein [Kitasatospora aureofaciens]ARF83201.1 hypothetical protein B6264_30115 [Kitasatospora aureofaciens]OEV38975.1 hypothetical protein HS99_0017855 [Kitasatospora aureofaciens]GGU99214.1 hypothetical protein GCM10010502_62030 [Kitasatospora aureofaciens]